MARTLELDTITEPGNSGTANITLSSDTTTTMPKVDINSGTIDGTAIGVATPSSMAATTLSATGNATVGGTLGVTGATTMNGDVTLGNATTDTITVSGTMVGMSNKLDKEDQKGITHSLTFSGNNITTGTTRGFNNYVAGDRIYIANASSNVVNYGEFLIDNYISNTVLDLKRADGSTDAGFTSETISSSVYLVSIPKFTRQGLTQLAGEIKLYASVTESVIQGLGSITYAGASRYFWLPCNGAAVSRVVYDDLFDVIGTTFGAGDTTSTFNLPDLRGRVPVGDDTMAGETATRMPDAADNIGNSGGVHEHTLTEAQSALKAHGHADTLVLASGTLTLNNPTMTRGADLSPGPTNSGGYITTRDGGADGSLTPAAWSMTGTVGTALNGQVTDHAGSSATAHSILQPYLVVGSYIIAT